MKKYTSIIKKLHAAFFSVICAFMLTLSAFAATANPLTGDRQNIGIVMVIAGAALLVIIIVAAVSAKKGKK